MSAGEPPLMVDWWETPPMTIRPPAEAATSVREGLVAEWAAQWKALTG